MRIICTVTNDLNYDQRMIRICSTLVEAGYEVLLVGRQKADSKPLRQQNFQQHRLTCYFEKGKFFYLEYNIRLMFFLFGQQVDVINSIDLDSLLSGVIVGRLRGKKVVYDAHEYYTEVPELVNRPMTQAIWKFIANACIPRVDMAYTVCESLSKIFEQKYKKSFSVVRNVPFVRAFAAANAPQEHHILYQGALNEGRGLEQMIESMAYISDACLWLAGEGDLSKALRHLVQTKGLNERVKFLGYLSPEALWEVTQNATIGINLLENKGLSYYYSLANKAFDYIQAGIPSINMNFPEYQLINEQYATFVLIDDLEVETIANATNQLLKDHHYYQQIKENCSIARKELNWSKEKKKLLEVYARLLG